MVETCLDTEAVALFLARRCCFFSAARVSCWAGASLESLLACDTGEPGMMHGTLLKAFSDVEPNEVLRGKISVGVI